MFSNLLYGAANGTNSNAFAHEFQPQPELWPIVLFFVVLFLAYAIARLSVRNVAREGRRRMYGKSLFKDPDANNKRATSVYKTLEEALKKNAALDPRKLNYPKHVVVMPSESFNAILAFVLATCVVVAATDCYWDGILQAQINVGLLKSDAPIWGFVLALFWMLIFASILGLGLYCMIEKTQTKKAQRLAEECLLNGFVPLVIEKGRGKLE